MVTFSYSESVADHGARDDVVMTADEVAALLKVGKTTVYRLVRQPGTQRLPARKVGREWRFLRSEVLSWLRENPGGGQG